MGSWLRKWRAFAALKYKNSDIFLLLGLGTQPRHFLDRAPRIGRTRGTSAMSCNPTRYAHVTSLGFSLIIQIYNPHCLWIGHARGTWDTVWSLLKTTKIFLSFLSFLVLINTLWIIEYFLLQFFSKTDNNLQYIY